MPALLTVAKGLRDYWWRPIDPRPYAAVRIAFAAAAFLNWLQLWLYRVEYFTDAGMIDLGAVHKAIGLQPLPSLLDAATSPAAITAFFIAGLAALVGLA